jgi:hypothetical protein
MYFDNFPKLLYDFDVGVGKKFILVKDITQNVRFQKEFLDKMNLYESYRITDGESIEVVSEKIYGTPDYHWMLMLLNQRYDYIEDFPMSSANLDAHITRKYGDRRNDVAYYVNKTGVVENTHVIYAIVDTKDQYQEGRTLLKDLIRVGDVIRRKTSIGDYVGSFQGFVGNTKDLNVLMTTGGFKVGDAITVYRYSDDRDGNLVETVIAKSTVTKAETPLGYTPITNYENEYLINEKKRIIKIIPQQYLQQILSEFEQAMLR